jgi:hypothetical protein
MMCWFLFVEWKWKVGVGVDLEYHVEVDLMSSQEQQNKKFGVKRFIHFCSGIASMLGRTIWVSACASTKLQHHDTNPATILVNVIPLIHTTGNRIRPIIEQIIMQLSISGAEFLLF